MRLMERLTQFLLFGYYLLHLTESIFIFNVTNTQNLLCHSCRGDSCQKISDDENNVIACDRFTQLCWAGFVNQKPYRTCASRYCTPAEISFDSDIRIETCCRSNLCNSIPLSWSTWARYYQTTTTSRPVPPTTSTSTVLTTRRPTTKRSTTTQYYYVVDEIVNGEQKDTVPSNVQLNTSDAASFGINWEGILFVRSVSLPVASSSKLLLLVAFVLYC